MIGPSVPLMPRNPSRHISNQMRLREDSVATEGKSSDNKILMSHKMMMQVGCNLQRLLSKDMALWERKTHLPPYLMTHIELSCCQLDKMPEDLVYFTHIQYLSLFNNKITSLDRPKNIKFFTLNKSTLKSLNISHNFISRMPKRGLENCTLLERLDISKNMISRLPDYIKKFENLGTLHLESNNIAVLPLGLSLLKGTLKEFIIDWPLYLEQQRSSNIMESEMTLSRQKYPRSWMEPFQKQESCSEFINLDELLDIIKQSGPMGYSLSKFLSDYNNSSKSSLINIRLLNVAIMNEDQAVISHIIRAYPQLMHLPCKFSEVDNCYDQKSSIANKIFEIQSKFENRSTPFINQNKVYHSINKSGVKGMLCKNIFNENVQYVDVLETILANKRIRALKHLISFFGKQSNNFFSYKISYFLPLPLPLN